MAGKERRKNPRTRTKPGNYASYAEGSGGLRDLSLVGVFVEDPEPLDEGMEIDLHIHIGAEAVLVRGVVKRSVPKQGMAVQFQQISQVTRGKLVKCISALGGKI